MLISFHLGANSMVAPRSVGPTTTNDCGTSETRLHLASKPSLRTRLRAHTCMRLTTVGRGGSWVQRGGAFVVRGSLCWRCGRGARPSGRLAVAAPLRPLAARSLVCAPRVLARAPAPDSYDTSIETREGRRVPRPLRPCTASLRLRTLRLVAARASSTRCVDRLGGSADARVDVGTASLRDGDEAVQLLSERPRRRCVARRLRLASRNARPGPTPGADPTSRCASWGGVARYGVRALTQRLHAAPRGATLAGAAESLRYQAGTAPIGAAYGALGGEGSDGRVVCVAGGRRGCRQDGRTAVRCAARGAGESSRWKDARLRQTLQRRSRALKSRSRGRTRLQQR